MRPMLPALALALAALPFHAEAPTQAPAPAPAANGVKPTPPPPPADGEPKPYEKVITSEAKTQTGLFKVHQVKSKLYFEIPKDLLGKELLMVATATEVPVGADHVGKNVNEDVVRFLLKENKVYFQAVNHAFVSDPSRPIASAVEASQRDIVLLAFPVEALSKDGAPVIEVSKLFTSEVGDFTARQVVNATSMDPSRSFVDHAKTFAGSVRVDAVHTYSLAPHTIPGLPPMPGQPQPPARSGSVSVAYDIVRLPEKPMMARLMDDRIGYFGLSRVDFGSPEHESKRENIIARWRLEKKNPSAALSEPVKPIVWYIDKATPSQWVPYIKKGVEAWNVAFEAAGFKNAVQARPFPTKEEDPEFDPEDVRYSVIRWVPSPIANAYGPHLSDPRSGEILNADIVMYHNILQLQRDWYITQAGAVDPRAQKLPLPDDLMGDLVAYVVTHECGHSLGFRHNMKSSSLYPFEKLRDGKWLKEMGHVATLMDYSRFNYLVQPEDKIDPALLIPKIGPYDIFAVKWGYAPIPEAKTPEEEKATLNAWAKEQDAKPWLRFSTPKAELGDYGENTEAVGDADAVAATTLGTKNLQRIVKMLPKMAIQPGQDDHALEELYGASWGQWTRELGHVAAIVGGYDSQNKHGDQPGAVFTPATKAQQAKAVKFLSEQIFKTPTWMFETAVTERLSPMEPSVKLLNAQRYVLRALLDRARTTRLQTQEIAAGDKAYRVADLLADLRAGIYTEVLSGAKVDPLRRNLQRAYLAQLDERLNAGTGPALPAAFTGVTMPFGNPMDDTRATVRGELKALAALFSAKATAAADRTQKAHLEDLRDLALKAVDPKVAPNLPPAMSPFRSGFSEDNCWPDFTQQ
ncbi:glutaminyl-tRNA synthetase [Geothrix limicola]|uniref:Glutaminyl-tRNA synthetase n=1 Tax=Geothrix limicola TaxID=2927978 RepID=A0ABQ5QG72_9BACT|nr:zinc-dependent metalloprotease [Geothrix limicola]GLH73840.1 glutaminyl-tRNA synthetase [Geothrix limicola]